jgi:hypothetical protein
MRYVNDTKILFFLGVALFLDASFNLKVAYLHFKIRVMTFPYIIKLAFAVYIILEEIAGVKQNKEGSKFSRVK